MQPKVNWYATIIVGRECKDWSSDMRQNRDSTKKWDAFLYRHGLEGDSQLEAMFDKKIFAMSSVFIGASGSTFTLQNLHPLLKSSIASPFSNFGTMQDVRIPYEQKQIFGFVTFLHSETVRIILARGNPHFICESRVLVKPYKEKGRILEVYQYSKLNEAKDVSRVYGSCLKSDKFRTPSFTSFFLSWKQCWTRRFSQCQAC